MWQDALVALGTGTVLIGAVAWLFRALTKHLLDKDVEQYRAGPKATHDSAVERLKSELHMKAFEHEVRFRNIHERVAETLAETYARLYQLVRAVGSYVAEFEFSNEPSKEEKLERVSEANDAFNSYYLPRQIYLPPDIDAKVSALYQKLYRITNRFTFALVREKAARGHASRSYPDDYWGRALETFQDEAKPLFEELRADFQRMLGMSMSNGGGTDEGAQPMAELTEDE